MRALRASLSASLRTTAVCNWIYEAAPDRTGHTTGSLDTSSQWEAANA